MTLRPALLLLLLPLLLAAFPLAGQEGDARPVPERYKELATAGDHAGLVALWTSAREAIIPTIDADLEGSLGLWEKQGEEARAEIDALIARALVGARAATEAVGSRRILDYVSSFAGWDAAQKKDFRAGQAAFGGGRQASTAGDHATALAKGRECRSLAEPLGDWWGTAMGLQLEGVSLLALGRKAEAAEALSRARLIYRELFLTSTAIRIEFDLATILAELGRLPRAREMIRDGKATAERIGLTPYVARFARLEESLNSGEDPSGDGSSKGD